MTTTKNYTEEQTRLIKELYEQLGNDGLEEIGNHEQIDKSLKSVRAKLVKEGVYVIPDKPANIRKNGPSKKEIIRDIEGLGIVDKGLIGATKDALLEIRDFAERMNDG